MVLYLYELWGNTFTVLVECNKYCDQLRQGILRQTCFLRIGTDKKILHVTTYKQ